MIYGSDKELFYFTYTAEKSDTATTDLGNGYFEGRLVFQHGLPYIPLVYVIFSLDPTFATFNIATDIYDAFRPTQELGSAYAIGDTREITIYFQAPAAKKTMYFRVFGFRNPTYTGPIEPKKISQQWRFNTDLKYPQLVALGKFTGNTYTHNLGYKPLALEWFEAENDGAPYACSLAIPKVTNTTITLRPDSGNYTGFYLALFNQPGI